MWQPTNYHSITRGIYSRWHIQRMSEGDRSKEERSDRERKRDIERSPAFRGKASR